MRERFLLLIVSLSMPHDATCKKCNEETLLPYSSDLYHEMLYFRSISIEGLKTCLPVKIAWNTCTVSGIGDTPNSSRNTCSQRWYWRKASLERLCAAYASMRCLYAASS